MTGAIARRERPLSSAIAQLPPFMRRANSTFVNLRATLDDLDAAGRRLQAGRAAAARRARRAAPVRPRGGADGARPRATSSAARARATTSIELAQARCRRCATSPSARCDRNGKERPGAFPTAANVARGPDAGSSRSSARTPSTSPAGWTTSATRACYDANGVGQPRGDVGQRVRSVDGVLTADPARRCARRCSAAPRRRARTTAAPARRSTATPTAPTRGSRRRASTATRARCCPVTEALARLRGRRGRRRRAASCSAIGARAAAAAASATSVELDNAFGLIEGADVKVAGVRAGKVTSTGARPRDDAARWSASSIDRAGLRRPARRRVLRDAAAVADRRVLPRLQARHGRSAACPRARPCRSSRRARRSPSTSSTTSCAARTASASRSCSASSAPASPRAAPDLNDDDPPREPGAARDRPRARACSREQRRTHPRPLPRRRPRRLAAGDQPQGRHALRRRGARHRGHGRHAPAASCAASTRRFPSFLRELRPTMTRSATPPSAQAPALRRLRDERRLRRARCSTTLGPFAEVSRPGVPHARRGRGDRPRRGQGRDARASPSCARSPSRCPRRRPTCAIVLEHLDDPKFAVEKDPRSPAAPTAASPGLEALLRYICGAVAGDQHLRRQLVLPEGLGVPRPPVRDATPTRRRSRPRRNEKCLAVARAQPAGHHDARPDEDGRAGARARTRRAGARAAGARERAPPRRARRRSPAPAPRRDARRRRRRQPPPVELPEAARPAARLPDRPGPPDVKQSEALLDYLLGS